MRHFAAIALSCLILAGCGRAALTATPAHVVRPQSLAAASDVSLRKDVLPMIKARCATCHGSWVTAAGEPNTDRLKRDIQDMILRVERRNMPKDKPGSVTDAELAALKAWQAAGTPDN